METEGRKILVVDDSPEFAEIVAQILEDEGFEISIAPNGNTAIAKVSSESPELVLLDLKLPDITGEEVLRRIKETNEDTTIIIVTGYGGEQVAVDLMKAGTTDFLSKPFDRGILLNAIKNALQIRDAQIEERRTEKYSSLEKFFPFLAHEVRNPLHAIGGALAIIQRRSDLTDEFLGKSITIIQEEVHHLNEFVQECLNFVRPPTRGYFIEIEINEVVSSVINMISHMFEELSKKIKITAKLYPHLPKVVANYDEIKQAFLNVVKNSFEAMGEGGELIIKTRFKSSPHPGWVEVVFADNGPGIKEENIEKVFAPFFTTKLRGTGLGMAICQRIIIERHHGKIHLASEEGKGTTIAVELPVSLSKRPPGGKIE